MTQPVYERYRQGGRIEWVLANARALAEAKVRLNSPTPTLRWQYLTFEHNVHEVPRAIETAREIGFDTFNLATPNAVDEDDPTIHAVAYAGPAEHKAMRFTPWVPLAFDGDLSAHREVIETALAESAVGRWHRETGGEEPSEDKTGHRCDWLHLAVISDAMGRIVPCCNGDYVGIGRMQLTDIAKARGNIMGSPDYRAARQFLVDPEAAREANAGVSDTKQVVCARCPGRPLPQVGLGAVGAYVAETPAFADMAYLHDRSLHTPL